jgi:hypothetical protein
MNMTPEQIEQWKDACNALRDGERIQVQLLSGEWADTTIFDPRLPHRRKPKAALWTLADHMRRFFPTWDGATMPLHRTDWTENMLLEGWRPLLKGEAYKNGDEFKLGSEWRVEANVSSYQTTECCYYPTRTRRPLPTPPRMVPLTRADVPFGSVFRAVSGNDFLPVQIGDHGITLALHGESGFRGWTQLQSMGWLIHRPGDNDADGKPVFRKCEKEETE